ncbi:TPA: hypothetical protein ACT5CJ_002377 [Flavobacterium psychrophilum]
MTFFKKLFGIKEKPLTETINVFGKNYVIDLSPEAQEKKKKEYELEYNNRWIGSNEIESTRDDGFIIYKLKRVNATEREQIGIYGLKWFSNNNKFCVIYSRYEEGNFNIGLVDVEQKKILFKLKLNRPHRCRLTNNGLVICEDWGNNNSNSNYIYVIDVDGKILYKKRHNTSIGDTFELIENETKFKYNINYSGQIHIINLEEL